jgi:hypothetical protein
LRSAMAEYIALGHGLRLRSFGDPCQIASG